MTTPGIVTSILTKKDSKMELKVTLETGKIVTLWSEFNSFSYTLTQGEFVTVFFKSCVSSQGLPFAYKAVRDSKKKCRLTNNLKLVG